MGKNANAKKNNNNEKCLWWYETEHDRINSDTVFSIWIFFYTSGTWIFLYIYSEPVIRIERFSKRFAFAYD